MQPHDARLVALRVGKDQAAGRAVLILEEFDVEWVRLSVNKPGAIRHSKDVGVAVLRTRADLAAGAGK